MARIDRHYIQSFDLCYASIELLRILDDIRRARPLGIHESISGEEVAMVRQNANRTFRVSGNMDNCRIKTVFLQALTIVQKYVRLEPVAVRFGPSDPPQKCHYRE